MLRKAFNQISQSAVYREDEVSVSITVCGGSYGGGSETLVVEANDCCTTEIFKRDDRRRRNKSNS